MRNRLATLPAVGLAALAGAAPANAIDSNCPNANAQPDQVSVTDYSDSLLCVANETRREWGRPMLDAQRNLARAAGWKADDMTANDYFSHISPEGVTLGDRLDQANFIPRSDRWRAGENLAGGRGQAGSAVEIVDGWMNSHEHRINLLDPSYTMAGVGVSRGWPGTEYPDNGSLTIAMDLGWRRP
jgi:uncharacterized protein YkwD